VAVQLGYDETLAHRIIAGADAIVLPSRFEPCGLTQLYGLRYGTVPIVRRVGGLIDTVDEVTGFGFLEPERTLTEALRLAVEEYATPATWQARMREGMRRDHGWSNAASRYVTLYQSLLQAAASPS